MNSRTKKPAERKGAVNRSLLQSQIRSSKEDAFKRLLQLLIPATHPWSYSSLLIFQPVREIMVLLRSSPLPGIS